MRATPKLAELMLGLVPELAEVLLVERRLKRIELALRLVLYLEQPEQLGAVLGLTDRLRYSLFGR